MDHEFKRPIRVLQTEYFSRKFVGTYVELKYTEGNAFDTLLLYSLIAKNLDGCMRSYITIETIFDNKLRYITQRFTPYLNGNANAQNDQAMLFILGYDAHVILIRS